MNRSQDLQILAQNPAAAGDFAKAVRKGIVKGFFAVKNPDKKLTEEGIRKFYKIPDTLPVVWLPDGSAVFMAREHSIRVKPDGGATKVVGIDITAGATTVKEEPWEA